MPMIQRLRRSRVVLGLLVLVVAGGAVGTGTVVTNTFSMGDHVRGLVRRVDRFFNPVPDRPTIATLTISDAPEPSGDEPQPSDEPTPSAAPGSPSPKPGRSNAPSSASSTTPAPPTPTPRPARQPVDRNSLDNPGRYFASEVSNENCAAAAVQIVLAIWGKADTSDSFQRKLDGRIREWESYADSHNGGWGPASMVLALQAYGVDGYEIHAHEHRMDAMRDAARQLDATGAPSILLAWKGAHAWVMTGYRSDSDPTAYRYATIQGLYILDPWYPRVSSIWGASDPPGTFQDSGEMVRNYREWQRPEGHYADRDGTFILLVPTKPLTSSG